MKFTLCSVCLSGCTEHYTYLLCCVRRNLLYVFLWVVCRTLLKFVICIVWSACLKYIENFPVCSLSLGTKLYILSCVFSLSVLICTYCRVCSLFRYGNLHIAACGISVCTEQNILQCAVFLFLLNCTNLCVCYFCRYRNIHIALFRLSVRTEL